MLLELKVNIPKLRGRGLVGNEGRSFRLWALGGFGSPRLLIFVDKAAC